MSSSFAARTVSPFPLSSLSLLRRFVFFGGLLCGAFAFAQTTTPEPIVVTFTDLALERTYTGLPQEPVSWTISPGTVENYTYKVTYNGSTTLPKNAGTYTVKITGAEKAAVPPLKKPRSFSTSGKDKIIVAKAPLTVRAVPAQKFYGSSNPKLSFSYEGFLNGETHSVLNTKPTVKTTVTSSTPAGVYPGAITVVGGSDNNYVIPDANRIPADFTIAAFASGSHEALLMGFGEAPVGKIEITLPTKGDTFTGRLHLAEEASSHPFSGKLVLAPDSLSAKATASVKRPAVTKTATAAYQYDIGVTLDPVNGLSLTLDKSNGTSFYTLGPIGKVRVHVAKTNPAPWEGAHTLSLYEPTATFGFFSYPQGDGYATAVIGADGKLTLKGKLADGTSLTGTLYSDADGGYRVYLRPYGGRLESDFGGFLKLLPHPALTTPKQRYHIPREGADRSIVFWRKARVEPVDKIYPDGIEELYIYPGLDPWMPPAAGKKATKTTDAIDPIILAQRLGLAATHTETTTFMIDYGQADFGQRDLDGAIAYAATLAPNNAVRSALSLSPDPAKPNLNPANWTLSFNASTGTFSGGFSLVDIVEINGVDKKITRNVKFEGILRQLPDAESNLHFGAGFVITPKLPYPDGTVEPAESEPVRFSPFPLP